jgi:hypothetical protein
MAAGLMAVALRLDGLPELDRDEVPAQDVLVEDGDHRWRLG